MPIFNSGGPPRRRPWEPNACGCGGSPDQFAYIRPTDDQGAPKWTAKGNWYCMNCGSPILPNRERGDLTDEIKARLERVAQLHSNEGWGDEFRHDRLIACALPQPGV